MTNLIYSDRSSIASELHFWLDYESLVTVLQREQKFMKNLKIPQGQKRKYFSPLFQCCGEKWCYLFSIGGQFFISHGVVAPLSGGYLLQRICIPASPSTLRFKIGDKRTLVRENYLQSVFSCDPKMHLHFSQSGEKLSDSIKRVKIRTKIG